MDLDRHRDGDGDNGDGMGDGNGNLVLMVEERLKNGRSSEENVTLTTTTTTTTTAIDRFVYEDKIDELVLMHKRELSVSSITTTTTTTNTIEKPNIKRLCIFDFDNTLFHSPSPNKQIWDGSLIGLVIESGGWYRDIRTLSSPYIPHNPDASWFNPTVLEQAQQAAQDPETLCVLMTGRLHSKFATRILEILELSRNSIYFDLVLFREGHLRRPSQPRLYHATTFDFKIAVLHRLLTKFHGIQVVEMWDDRPKHVEMFERELDRLIDNNRIQSGKVHTVTESTQTMKTIVSKDLEKELVADMIQSLNEYILTCRSRPTIEPLPCNNDRFFLSPKRLNSTYEMTPITVFTGILFPSTTRDTILSKCASFLPPTSELNWSFYADHCTLSLGEPNPELCEWIGKSVSLRVTHWGVYENRVIAIAVELFNQSETTLNEIIKQTRLHITLAVGPSGKPRESNNITSWNSIPDVWEINGTIDVKILTGVKAVLDPAIIASQVPKDVSIGGVVKKLFPELKGREIGDLVKKVEEWMVNEGIENRSENASLIEDKTRVIGNQCIN